MMVVLVVYSCLGMQLYGNQFNEFEELPRENFGTNPAAIFLRAESELFVRSADNFVMAFLGLFQV